MKITDMIIKTIEAIAWTKKYLIAASVRLKVNLLRIRGIILIKLISNPNQHVNHELADTATIEPINKKFKNTKLNILNNKKKEICTLI